MTSKHAPPVLVDLEKFEAAYKRVEQQQIAEPKQKLQTELQAVEVEHKKELKHGKEMLALEVRKHFHCGLEEGRLSASVSPSSDATPARTRTTRRSSPTPRLLHNAGFESFTMLKDAFRTYTGKKVLRAGPFSLHLRSKAKRSCQSGRGLLTDGSNAMALD